MPRLTAAPRHDGRHPRRHHLIFVAVEPYYDRYLVAHDDGVGLTRRILLSHDDLREMGLVNPRTDVAYEEGYIIDDYVDLFRDCQ